MSEADLFERICKQKYLRRWAVFILVFEMPGLHRNTLEILERRLLHLGRMWFPEAIWDNILGLSPFAQSLSSAWNTCPDLDSLAQMIIEQVRRKVPHASKGVYRPCLPPTHSLGSPCHEVHGLAHRKGRWTYLLPGSRVSSLYPNFAAIERDRIAFAILSKFYWEGMIAWRKGTRKRPAGMAVVETILFRSGGEAEKFLFAGGTVAEKLHRVMER
ncbi:hypothetical protein RA25_21090 [Leisingera sp. ANG-S5]|nr:hypothetical protein RA21_04200 [Leisingera sp. ANG-DT]KIC28710.1 hypothetical protein RA25_21090 [Leisingera sp. ANG-S5]